MDSPSSPPDRVAELAARRRSGWSLEGAFYIDEAVYRLELERIWRRGWLFAGHTAQLPEAGDWFTFELDQDSLIIIRGDDGAVHALHNVCRHRGTQLCAPGEGHASKLVCPYHQWVYGRDGRLLSAWGMQEELDRSSLGLKRVAVKDLEGLIFISLAAEPPDFEEAQEVLAPTLRPQGLRRARVAKVIDYQVPANWKLVWENNRECYHCNVNHPQYIKANFDHYNAKDSSEQVLSALEAETRRSEARWAASGLSVSHKETGMTVFPDRHWFSANRTPLVPGYLSETLDGRQAAPLMGDYADPDVGTLRIRTLPNFWNHSSCDHAVSTRLVPLGPRLTGARVTWLVDLAAVEGTDYRLEELTPFWQLTSEQDWKLCERAQRGVSSPAYTPGPLSTLKEYNVEGWIRWYLRELAGERGRTA
jgi:Rieske 2Fe-2S family protein